MIGYDRRAGYTIRDMMVAIAVIGVALGLSIMLLAQQRGGITCRTSCLNNMHNIAIALQNYLNLKNRFPNAGTFGDDDKGTYTSQINSTRLTIDQAGSQTNSDGFDRGPLYSWVLEISPYLDIATLYNDFNRDRVYFDDPAIFARYHDTTRASNLTLGDTPFSVLSCPNDSKYQAGHGNLSYAVNLGFARWAGLPRADDPSVVEGTSWHSGLPNNFTWGVQGYQPYKQTSLFFLGTKSGKAAWDMYHTPATIRDGASTTIMLAENINGGASSGSPYGWTYHGQPVPTNWATPHPNFIGFITSDDVCGAGPDVDCRRATDLQSPDGTRMGSGWSRANSRLSPESINWAAKNRAAKGSQPFANGAHQGLVVVAMCDGHVRVINDSIDGGVWAKLITPDGGNLPVVFRQTPLSTQEAEAPNPQR